MSRRALVAVLIGAALLVGGLLIALHESPAARAAAELQRVLADFRGRGVPTTFEELCGPEPAPTENGWEEVQAAIAWRDAHVRDDWRTMIVGPWNMRCVDPWWETATPEEMTELARFLEEMQPCLSRLDAAVLHPELRPPLSPLLADGEQHSFASTKTLQEAGELLEARARGAREEPERRQALTTLLRLARGVDPRTCRWVSIARNAVFEHACVTLQTCLASQTLDVARARADLDGLLDTRAIDGMRAAVLTTLVAECEALPHVIRGEGQASPSLRDMVTRALSGRNPFAPALDIDPVLAVGLLPQLERAGELEPRWDRSYEDEFAACFPVTPVNRRPDRALIVHLQHVRLADARSRLARVALAAYTHFAAHGAWPSSPDALRPLFDDGRVPCDPYTGEMFRWELADDALVVAAQPWTSPHTTWDAPARDPEALGLVWHLRPPAAR